MIRHDFHDVKCGRTFEVTFASSLDFQREMPCECGGTAQQVWLRAPGLAGVEEPSTRGISRSFVPGYDMQTGRVFNSRSERDTYVKSRGGIVMGPEEYNRSRVNAPSEREPDFSKLPEAMEKAWQEMKAGKKGEPIAHLDPNAVVMEAK